MSERLPGSDLLIRVENVVKDYEGPAGPINVLRSVNLQLRSFSAKEGAIERQHRRALR